MIKEEISTRIQLFIQCQKADYNKDINFNQCYVIPKKELIVGEEYSGYCRNSDKARWNGKEFEYERYKFGSYYTDTINHFEDDDGFDLFIPIKVLT